VLASACQAMLILFLEGGLAGALGEVSDAVGALEGVSGAVVVVVVAGSAGGHITDTPGGKFKILLRW